MPTISSNRCTVFDRIVCAFDSSEPSFEAARQACSLRSETGELEIDWVFEPPVVAYSPYGGPMIIGEAERSAAAALAEAKSVFPDAATHLLHGTTVGRLLERLTEWEATLVAVGATSRNRGVGVARGSVMTSMLHRAHASVLVARAPAAGGFPDAVAVGYDGSPPADRALAAGLAIADRHSTDLCVVVAAGAELTGGLRGACGPDGRTGREAPRGGAVRRLPRRRPPDRRKSWDPRCARPRQRQRAGRPSGGLLGARDPLARERNRPPSSAPARTATRHRGRHFRAHIAAS